MAYYTALVNAWNSVTQPPAGVTGSALTAGMTTAQKLAAVNAWTVATGVPIQAIFTPSQVLNACAAADLNALTTAQVGLLSLLLAGGSVDASQGKPIRAQVQTIFAGKATTLANLAALVASYDSPRQLWWQANGYTSPISTDDLVAAGGLV